MRNNIRVISAWPTMNFVTVRSANAAARAS
jgi:hypothetical protein